MTGSLSLADLQALLGLDSEPLVADIAQDARWNLHLTRLKTERPLPLLSLLPAWNGTFPFVIEQTEMLSVARGVRSRFHMVVTSLSRLLQDYCSPDPSMARHDWDTVLGAVFPRSFFLLGYFFDLGAYTPLTPYTIALFLVGASGAREAGLFCGSELLLGMCSQA